MTPRQPDVTTKSEVDGSPSWNSAAPPGSVNQCSSSPMVATFARSRSSNSPTCDSLVPRLPVRRSCCYDARPVASRMVCCADCCLGGGARPHARLLRCKRQCHCLCRLLSCRYGGTTAPSPFSSSGGG